MPRPTAALIRSGSPLPRDERVDLLEDARHRREVRRVHLVELDDDLLRVVRPVRERRADVERQQLDQQRERVGERQVEVGHLVGVDRARRLRHREDRAVVAVREDAALRRAGRAGGVDEGVGLLGRRPRRRGARPRRGLPRGRGRAGRRARSRRRRRRPDRSRSRARAAAVSRGPPRPSRPARRPRRRPRERRSRTATHSHSSGELVG